MANILPVALRAPELTVSASDAGDDLDEPPEKLPKSAFQRSTVRQPTEQASLLTKAILAQSDEETPIHFSPNTRRRRSITSNASSADLTSDTGFTSPSRVSTPSPPTTHISFLRLQSNTTDNKPGFLGTRGPAWDASEPTRVAPTKRNIQFACAARPDPELQLAPTASSLVQTVSAQEVPRRTCIKFACQARPAATQNTLPRAIPQSSAEPLTPRKESALATTPTTARPSPSRKPSTKGVLTRPRFLRATSKDLVKDGSQFHEFASDVTREDDWIRNDSTAIQAKLTISDTLQKENTIRRLATEVEEEEAKEDDDDNEDEGNEDDGDEDEDEDDNDDEVDEDNDEEDNDAEGVDLDDYDAELEDGDSDGYHTDEETGFAESDDEEDEDENMILWTPGHMPSFGGPGVGSTRRFSINEQHSDSSANSKRRVRRAKSRPIGPTAEATDLPDSTDFVCGTLDEDRPLEEVFISCLAARRTEKLRVIPQDIDPSFPASDLEEEDEEDAHNLAQHDSDSNVWVMDDLHHDQDRSRRQKGDQSPPRRLRSPPPTKRHQSPPHRVRGRSPKPLFDGHSPRRMRSPAPKAMTTPAQSPRQGAHIQFHLAGRPGLMHTKSLPRSAALFRHPKQPKCSKNAGSDNDMHVRGAIDIVKGLEKKRQRRREKFMQRYCNRARRGQMPERKPHPGLGAERMKEIGLIMAGKKDHGNYVLSF